MSYPARLFTTLIRTHHITSRKKLHRVKKAASHRGIPYVLVRYGGSPGIMYAECRDESSLNSWVSTVHELRYKDFQCVQKPTAETVLAQGNEDSIGGNAPFNEVESVAEFGTVMERKGLERWWKLGMGYEKAK
ncbi:hypothetical protein BKA67DRAFT_556761 [Truncatella angustata]|uniref:Uncharacterized protein n=1 Tax=Truncatella angustata TaxID=152316 RepID=A0A9P8UTS6_9PEZI|nr:uncharacterized protein BKA67DRAFT_556761 [Truncatella angustata]KAH6657937.1 hypothetical protein BKA67DRAFT_556761 [Truncatella angustata]KAH8195912.1 hypothetical protein TruAng_009925 [Truncatella angustata]